MSTIKFSKKEIADLYTSVLNNRDLEHYLISNEEIGYKFKLSGKAMTNEEIENNIACFFQRASIANQLAYRMTYSDTTNQIIIDLLTEDDLKTGSYLSRQQLEQKLSSLHYNLYNNAGRAFFGKADEEKLQHWINQLKSLIAMRCE